MQVEPPKKLHKGMEIVDYASGGGDDDDEGVALVIVMGVHGP